MKKDMLRQLLRDSTRLAALYNLDLLDTPADPTFDRLARLAAAVVQTPVALVVLLDADRQFFKSCLGLPEPWASRRETPLSHSFCQHSLLSGEPLIVEDARCHPTFISNLAIRDLGVVAYLGIPLRTSEGYAIGTFCVIDPQPRQWLPRDINLLQELAELVMAEIEGRRERRAREQAEQALRTSEARYRSLVETSPDAIVLTDLNTTILFCNQRAAQLYGSTRVEELIGRRGFEFIAPEDRQHAIDSLQSTLAAGSIHNVEYTLLKHDGTRFPVELNASVLNDVAGRPTALLAVVRDISERKRAEALLQHQALHDALTDLPNRALFLNRLEHALARMKRHPTKVFAVLFLDLDRFKQINDSVGHLIGDQLLIELAQRLVRCIRAEDMVARLGGDEFTVLLEEIQHASDAIEVVARIQQALALPFYLNGSDVVMSASIGVVLSMPKYDRSEELLRDADIALYRAKAQGKAQYAIFDPTMHAEVVARVQLETELRRAIEREELQLHYQPIVSLASGAISGVEALVRWQHPTRGLLTPTQFIPLAEETGLIVPLGEWVLRNACSQMQTWHVAGLPLTVAVNLSARQVRHHDLPARIAASLAETGLEPQFLKLELTESSILDQGETTSRLLADIHALGVQLAIDDFGTGYSCLTYLKRLPITSVKIDRTFVQDITANPTDAAIASAIIALAHRLNLTVVAEGIETEAQLAFCRAEQADAIQGYLVSHPLPAPALTPRLLARQCGSPELSDEPTL